MISVVVPTYNGSHTLPFLFDALLELEEPEGGYEIVAVDNASTDDTSAILAQYISRLPLKILSETRKGKSFALNTAFEHVVGDYIVFADDDVIPRPDWLRQYLSAAQSHPNTHLFAGQVRHKFEAQPPEWLVKLCEEGLSYGGTPVAQPEGPVEGGFFKGANFMVSREVLESVSFSVDSAFNFGEGGHSVGGEDTDFVVRAIGAGFEARYVSKAVVSHIVRKSQVAISAVAKRYYRIGRANFRPGDADRLSGIPTLLGYPRYLFRKVPLTLLKALVYSATGNSYGASLLIVYLSMEVGQQHERKRRFNAPYREV